MAKEETNPIDVLKSLSLDGVRTRIGKLSGELEALRVLEKALDRLENGAPARGPGGTRGASKMAARRDDVFAYLQKHGPAKPANISTECGIPGGSIHAVLDHEWFEKTSAGLWQIATAGK